MEIKVLKNILEANQDKADEIKELLQREKVAYALLEPAMLSAITRHPDARKYDFSSLKCILTGTGPIKDETILA